MRANRYLHIIVIGAMLLLLVLWQTATALGLQIKYF